MIGQFSVDVHVLHSSHQQTPQVEQWWEECKASLENLPINIHHVQGLTGPTHMLQNRKNGFMCGTAKYVSFVDPDDIVHGDPFHLCCEFLEENPSFCGAYTNSYIEDTTLKGTKQLPFFRHKEWNTTFHVSSKVPIHQIVVFRRDLIDLAFDYIHNAEESKEFPKAEWNEQVLFTVIAKFGPWKFFPDTFGYTWRCHPCGVHNDFARYESRRNITNLYRLILGNQ